VEEEEMKRKIDQTLITLISRCDAKEEPLRREERYLQAVRYFDGDTEAAKRSVLEADQKLKEETIDLVSQMTHTIMYRHDAHPSERKTSVSFLSSYIRSGFREYISEKKPTFPQEITLNVDSWTSATTDCSNAEALHRNYEWSMQQERQAQLSTVNNNAPTKRKITAGIIALFSVLGLFVAPPVGIVGLVAAVICFFSSGSVAKANKQRLADINAEYDAKIQAGHTRIDCILNEWNQAKAIVHNFEGNEIPDVVA
jgi:hypothetical protein